ncbi:hypothetical protein PROFUN_10448 [Planoprotostelium fungivorum]|uniref:Ubiquitin-like domain-containing protein n=1 Tax=Planoprotostelium fungivorum TaxID=1890364 RepID=A0A2P6NDZ3_9EUKA|nr:hypothetical protein PROFUN_10448 [Planoprotostelium fungivorum]
MKCYTCSEEKLSKEFFLHPLSGQCNHVPDRCLKCLTKTLRKEKSCPKCKSSVPSSTIQKIIQTFDALFSTGPSMTSTLTAPTAGGLWTITVSTLDGTSNQFKTSPTAGVDYLKKEISVRLKEKQTKLRLMFGAKELRNNTTLQEYGVRDGSSLQVLVLMMEDFSGEAYKQLHFDLNWGFPDAGADYLDGTCLLFSNQNHSYSADYERQRPIPAVTHTGDIIDMQTFRGHHGIDVVLSQIPQSITHLYFVLSAWNSPFVSKYPNPSVSLASVDRPNVNLCSLTVSEAGNVQAIIMCRVERMEEGKWSVQKVAKGCSGNAKNYAAIIQAIQQLQQ